MTDGPLAGITVYDFSQVLAAPYGAVLLAEYGADVVTVEPPGGSAEREILEASTFPNVTHNKRSIAVDLKADGADELIERIANDADVIVHNYTPGTMERLGCGYETMKEYNEEIVFCSVTGFGEDGPYSDRRGYDPIAQSMSGLMSVTGEPDRKPSRVGASLIDHGVGAHLAFAAMSALWQAARTGEGSKIEVSLFDVAATYMGYWYTYYSQTGETPTRHGHSHGLNASHGLFETATELIFVEFGNQRHFDRLCAAVDVEEWHDDERINTVSSRNENREYLHETVEEEFRNWDREELLGALLDANVPAAPYNTIPEAIADPQLEHRGTVTSIDNEDGESVVIGGRPIHFEGFTPELESPPKLAEDTEEILMELGYSDPEIVEMIEAGLTPKEST